MIWLPFFIELADCLPPICIFQTIITISLHLIMKLLWIVCFLISQQEVPFKPKEEFSIELDYTFKQRPASATNTLEFKEGRQVTEKNNGPLPHLAFKLKFLKADADEIRMKAINDKGGIMVTRKIQLNEVINIQMGFMDDIKDRIAPSTHEVFIYTLSAKKTEIKKIHLEILEDGTFLVNGEKRGKF